MNSGSTANTCATPDCGTPSELYLCPPCISDFQAWIDKGRLLIPELGITIARLDNVRPSNVEGGNGSKSAGSAAPLDLTALALQMSLETDLSYNAEQYARDPWSVGEVPRVIADIKNAELAISGPEDPHIDHEGNAAKVKEIAPPMPTRQLLPWLRKNAKIAITSQHIRDWVRRGHLRPVEREPSPTYHPHEVIAAHNRKDTT